MAKFHDWAKRTGGITDHDFVEFSQHLTLCAMDAKPDKPPNFSLIGSSAASRYMFGDDWADNVVRTQKTPISKLDHISADGYQKALANGLNLDLIEYDDEKTRGTYLRSIIPLRTHTKLPPIAFAMFADLITFERKSTQFHGIFGMRQNRPTKILH